MQEFSSGLSAMSRGTAMHIALENLFGNITSLAVLSSLDSKSLDSLVAQAANQAIEHLGKQHQQLMTPRFKAIERQRIESLLLTFLQRESTRQEFEVIAREQEYHWQFDRLSLNLKIDRIDRLGDNSLALIDYKTGRSISSKPTWLEPRPEDMQLPLYFTVASAKLEDPVSSVNIAQINIEKTAYSGISASGNFHHSIKAFSAQENLDSAEAELSSAQSWHQLTHAWQEKVKLFATEFSTGKANVSPANGTRSCKYCELQGLCRIQEFSNTTALLTEAEDEALP